MSRVTLRIVEGPEWSRDEDGWEHNAYKVELRYEGRRMSVPWRQGVGITDDPEAERVLEALLMDASTIENAAGFEDWAEELGFDVDSRKAERIFKQAEKQTERFERLLGVELYRAALDGDDEVIARRLARGLDLARGL